MEKIATPFAGRLMHADMLIGKRQTIIRFEEKPTKRTDIKTPYFDVQSIVEGEGLVRYTTSAKLLVAGLRGEKPPLRDRVIAKDWRGLYFEDSVFTLEEEEEMLRKEFNINY